MLTNKKSLAKISSTPGKTQLINHFLVNDQWYLVDLPGYGWAKASKTNKLKWEKMIRGYLLGRENLATTLVLVDIRLDPQEIDTSFISWMGEKQLPFIIIFTKSDKLSKNKIQGSVQKYKHTLQKTWEEIPSIIISSSKNGIGKDEILTYLEEVLKEIPF
jgi:GTP-binding protein